MYEHICFGLLVGLMALCLTKVRSSRARCPATALIQIMSEYDQTFDPNTVEPAESATFIRAPPA